MRFLFVDRIIELVPGQCIRGIKQVTANDVYLAKNKEDNYFFIPSLLGEAVGQLAAWNVMFCQDFKRRPVAGVVGNATVFRPAFIGETVLLECTIDHLDDEVVRYHGTAKVQDEVIFSIENALGPLLPMHDFIEETVVRDQFAEINRPGPWEPRQTSIATLQPNHPLHVIPMTFDRIIDFNPGVDVLAEKLVSNTAPYFRDHFPKKPVLPMTVLLESKLHLASLFLSKSFPDKQYQASQLRRIKMNDFICPGDSVVTRLAYKYAQDDNIVLGCRTEMNAKRVCVLDIIMCPSPMETI